MIRGVLFALLTLLPLAAHAAYQDEVGAKLRWLDKVTARTGIIELHNDESANLGDVVVRVKACRAQDPLEGADSAAFLQIWESKDDEDPEWVYSGWMFSSSPGIAAMDHPVYDVWVLGCIGRTVAPAQASTAEPEPLPEATAEEEATTVAPSQFEEIIEENAAQPTSEEPVTVEEEPVDENATAAEEEPVEEEAATTEEPAATEEPYSEAVAPDDESVPVSVQPPVAPQPEADWDAPFNGYTHQQ